jgi:hypothetical protein
LYKKSVTVRGPARFPEVGVNELKDPATDPAPLLVNQTPANTSILVIAINAAAINPKAIRLIRNSSRKKNDPLRIRLQNNFNVKDPRRRTRIVSISIQPVNNFRFF